MTGSNLGRANLAGAILGRADLSGANLQTADLSGTDLQGAKLVGAYLGGANLAGAKNLTIEQLSQVWTLYEAVGLAPLLMDRIRKEYPHLLERPTVEK